MARTPSNMLELGTTAPDFSLPDPTNGKMFSLDDYSGRPVLIAFICNHCPFVLHILDKFVQFAHEYEQKGLSVIAINSNDVANYPDDSPEKMAEMATAKDFGFPYLFDESQEVARAYQAACTPDFFLFDADKKLVYRGQFDSARPGNDQPVTGKDMRAACDALLAGEAVSPDQTPSLGCNIKWKAG
ncbi:MAG: thioredoxin family protein [Thiotrichales bacterium]